MDRLYERIKSEVLWEPWAERDYFQWRRDRRVFRGRSDGWSGFWRMDIIWIWVKGQSDHQGSETETRESTAWFWGTDVIAISPSTQDIRRRQHWKGREPTVPWIPGREAFMLIHRQWARSDTTTAGFIVECGTFQRWETKGTRSSWETCGNWSEMW